MEVPVQADDDSMEVPVQSRVRRDRERVLIDAATVEGIKKRRKVVADGHESEDEENRTDHTMLQYCSDDEENRSGHRVLGFEMGGGRRRRLRSATPSEMADLEGIEFFKIILEKSSSTQVLPDNFVKMLDGHRPQNMKLRQAGNGLRRLWDMEMVFDTDGSMYLDRGWKQFIRAYDPRHGYFLVFRYDDNAMFTVKVFDTTMCRRRYQDEDDASNGRRSSEYCDRCYSKSSSDSSYSKSGSDSSYSNSSSKDEEERSGEEEEQSRDDEVVAHDGLAMVVVTDDDLAMVVVPNDGLALVIPQLGDTTMPIVVEEYIPQPGLGLRRSKRIRMMKEKGKKQ
ncbi:B3 domain-containing protein [Hordeum vulgare]|nr:B3 domain-containing protein [Hordeum vulgare]